MVSAAECAAAAGQMELIAEEMGARAYLDTGRGQRRTLLVF